MEDYAAALFYYQQALRASEKVVGKTHLDTLMTIMNMAGAYMDGLKDFTKAEEVLMRALDGYERLLGKDSQETKTCAKNVARLQVVSKPDKHKLRDIVKSYPFLLTDPLAGLFIRELLSGGAVEDTDDDKRGD